MGHAHTDVQPPPRRLQATGGGVVAIEFVKSYLSNLLILLLGTGMLPTGAWA